jgi:hypothetical protein
LETASFSVFCCRVKNWALKFGVDLWESKKDFGNCEKILCFLCCRVKNWALKFGVDLWEFGRQFTKMSEIQNVSKNTVKDHGATHLC